MRSGSMTGTLFGLRHGWGIGALGTALLLGGGAGYWFSQQKLANPSEVSQDGPTTPEEQKRLKAESQERLSRLAVAVIAYAQDWDERLPPVKRPDEAHRFLSPYVSRRDILTHPATGEPYLFNVSVSRTVLARFDDPAEIIVMYQNRPDPDSQRGIVTLNGKASSVDEARWLQLASISRLNKQPFIADPVPLPANVRKSFARLSMIHRALINYSQDHGNRLPPMTSSAAMQRALKGYVRDPSIFRDPLHNRPYLTNPALSGKDFSFEGRNYEAGTQPLLYEAQNRRVGNSLRRVALFANGQTRLVNPVTKGLPKWFLHEYGDR